MIIEVATQPYWRGTPSSDRPGLNNPAMLLRLANLRSHLQSATAATPAAAETAQPPLDWADLVTAGAPCDDPTSPRT